MHVVPLATFSVVVALLVNIISTSIASKSEKKRSTQANFKMLMRKAVLFHGGSDKKSEGKRK